MEVKTNKFLIIMQIEDFFLYIKFSSSFQVSAIKINKCALLINGKIVQ